MRNSTGRSGWQGVALVAVTYVYFLIFAQFAFLSRLAELNVAENGLKLIMASMAAAGILLSLLTPRVRFVPLPTERLWFAFAGCAAAALLSLLPLTLLSATAVALLIGASLGVLTVTLVTHLSEWTGDRNRIVKVGLGTGIGYFACNIPSFFAATPHVQAVVAAGICLIGMAITLFAPTGGESSPEPAIARLNFFSALAGFFALVWLDSAAFFIIQHAPALKADTWAGPAHLWTNAFVHLLGAVTAGWLLQRRGASGIISMAALFLGFACILLQTPSLVVPASLLYPAGVSLYSVALVAYPSFLSPADSVVERGKQAAWIYALAGWLGSALGIGMGQNLGRVPAGFVAVAGIVVLLPAVVQLLRSRWREVAVFAAALAVAFVIYRILPVDRAPMPLSAAERGRRVYIAEGCIHCHSQYVRPGSPDELLWGPVSSPQELRTQHPPLIGNRRQGPDLAEVGLRRSPLWLKAHMVDPREVSDRSVMPSYGFLFRDGRGDDLVAYLASLQSGDTQQHLAAEKNWAPSPAAIAHANAAEGRRLYERQCATCHEPNGSARLQYRSAFTQPPGDLFTGPFSHVHPSASASERSKELAQISKFGIPGTDMPGHEYLSDQQIASLTLWLMQRPAGADNRP